MAEPLFLLANIRISATALKRWLKSAPLSTTAFDDWPNVLASSDEQQTKGIPALDDNVASALVSHCMTSLEIDDGYLHCHYDERAGELHFAARYRYGDEGGAMASALSLCALLRGITAVYTAKAPSHIHVFDSGASLLCVEIQKKVSHVLSCSIGTRKDDWFVEWIGQNLNDPDTWQKTLLPSLARTLKKSISLGALRASAQNPYRYDITFWTDGQHVYRWPRDRQVEHADPQTFRRLTALNGSDAAFYADKQQVWYCRPMLGITQVQAIEPGTSIKGWLPYSADGEPVLRCGDTVWTTADIDYPGHKKTRKALASVRSAISALGGILIWEKVYSVEYLRPTQVDGRSFAQVEDNLFEDAQAIYIQTSQGLTRMDGAIPGQTTRVEFLYCNSGRVFYKGHQPECQPDAASLRHLSGWFYRDNRHVYFLDYFSTLRVLEGAEPANFRILKDGFSRDDQHVWIGAEMIPDVYPDAIRFFADSGYWTDGQRIYYGKKLIPCADPQNFEVLSNSAYARQRDIIYFKTEPVSGVDAATFALDQQYAMAHDQYRSYYEGKIWSPKTKK